MSNTRQTAIDDRMKRKKLEGVRVFVRDLFVNGFRNRDGLNELADNKTRAADENRQIIASILRNYYKFEKAGGERYFIAIDTRRNRHNPIHNIWKTKTFSGSDIMMHFYILDYLMLNTGSNIEITRERIFDYLQSVVSYDENDEARLIERSDGSEITVSENLSESKLYEMLTEMTELGIIDRNRGACGYCYSIAPSFEINSDMLDFASEVMPISTIGSYLLDRQCSGDALFAFKHNMISQVLDDEVMYLIFEAINGQREINAYVYSRATKKYSRQALVPLFIMRNVQTGRQYVACWSDADMRFKPVRLDYINLTVKDIGKKRTDYYEKKTECKKLYKQSWGINLFQTELPPKKASFTIQVDENTWYIANRLMREKRNGTVEDLGNWKYRFSMELYDPVEILPWITSFYGCIIDLEIDDEVAMAKLKQNFIKMIENHIDTGESKEVSDA